MVWVVGGLGCNGHSRQHEEKPDWQGCGRARDRPSIMLWRLRNGTECTPRALQKAPPSGNIWGRWHGNGDYQDGPSGFNEAWEWAGPMQPERAELQVQEGKGLWPDASQRTKCKLHRWHNGQRPVIFEIVMEKLGLRKKAVHKKSIFLKVKFYLLRFFMWVFSSMARKRQGSCSITKWTQWIRSKKDRGEEWTCWWFFVAIFLEVD